jgi:hypothetical protein
MDNESQNTIIKSQPPPLTDALKQHFKSSVVSWLSIDEEIVELQSKIKVLKDKKKKEVEPEIMDFMKTYNISDLNTQNGRLKYSEKNVKKGLNKKSIMENLILYYNNNEDKAEEVTNFIYDNREEKTTQKITKLKAKKMPLNMST